MAKTGVLLLNLGTPDAPQTPEVRRYLQEFLMDPRVIDLSAAGRTALVYGAILPFRPQRSAEAYRKVWMEEGSPLLVYGKALAAAVQAELGDELRVELAMRYGNPSMTSVLDGFLRDGFERIVVLPLYPQYASSSTGSSIERLYRWAAEQPVPPSFTFVPEFYDHPGFVEAQAAVIRDHLPESEQADTHVLFSFHGLPERQVVFTDPTKRHCFANEGCCDRIVEANRHCYRAQSFATARALAQRLGLAEDGWSIAFQSRLGRTPWIKPYTDIHLVALAQSGVKRLAVACPSFVADCLETLEEIGIRARESFAEAGGDELIAIPCVNSHPTWVRAVADLVRGALPAGDERFERQRAEG